MKKLERHIVKIEYKPERNAEDLVERIPFSTQGLAAAFVHRQRNNPNVISATYEGKEE